MGAYRMAIALVALLFFVAAASGQSGFLTRWLAFESQCAPACPTAPDTDALGRQIDALANRLIIEHGAVPPGEKGIALLNQFIFQDLGIQTSEDVAAPENLFLSSVLARRRGYCVGIAALYLALAEKFDVPIVTVATPTHVFLRYDDGTTRINIEPFQRGAHIPDEQYVREHRLPGCSIEKGVFLRNLSVDEFMARAHNNLGVIYSKKRDHARAAAEYEKATGLDRRFPAPLYNLGNDLLLQGEHRRAARLFTKALRLHPEDIWALNNRGLAYTKLGKREKARRDFEEALRIEPGFEAAGKNLAGL